MIGNQQIVGSNPTAGSLVKRGLDSMSACVLGHFLDTFQVPGFRGRDEGVPRRRRHEEEEREKRIAFTRKIAGLSCAFNPCVKSATFLPFSPHATVLSQADGEFGSLVQPFENGFPFTIQITSHRLSKHKPGTASGEIVEIHRVGVLVDL
jgi:hypothetical protein